MAQTPGDVNNMTSPSCAITPLCRLLKAGADRRIRGHHTQFPVPIRSPGPRQTARWVGHGVPRYGVPHTQSGRFGGDLGTPYSTPYANPIAAKWHAELRTVCPNVQRKLREPKLKSFVLLTLKRLSRSVENRREAVVLVSRKFQKRSAPYQRPPKLGATSTTFCYLSSWTTRNTL
jgi:hypothetical protein